ncbi:MAG: hypothetical protein HYX60_09725, partial [Legionella longbeachae]|nr:hypothetical protein [Legionella longbeachae]
MMTFKKFMAVIFKLPGTLFSGVLNILFGFTQKDKNGKVVLDANDDPVVFRGLFGLILDGLKFLTRSLSDFVANHKTA